MFRIENHHYCFSTTKVSSIEAISKNHIFLQTQIHLISKEL